MTSRVLPLVCFLAALAAAQEHSDLFEKAPPSVEQALRARVTEFYRLHTEGKFRAAEALVADDSQDDFYAMEKTKYQGCQVGKVTFSDNFTKAIAVTGCKSTWSFNGTRVPAMLALSSYWRFEKGDWYWYAPPANAPVDTPFGTFHVDPDADQKPKLPSNPAALAGNILGQVKADRTSVELAPDQPTHSGVRITNHMPGVVQLALEFRGFEGLKASLDKTQLGANETAVLSIDYEPSPKAETPDLTLNVRVSPTQEMIPIHVSTKPAPH